MTDELTTEHAAAGPTAKAADDLVAVRALVLRAHPGVVPELVQGGSIGELIASVPAATAAFERIVAAVGTPVPTVGGGATPSGGDPVGQAPPRVPAGTAPMVIDAEHLPAAEKIRRGLATRR